MFRTNGAIIGNTLERRTLDGREYAVAPVVAIVEGVLNGYFVPVEEIAVCVESWNGRPIPLRHPQRNGEFVSANSPDVVEAEVIGTFYNAYVDGNALKGEFWLDVAKIEKLGGIALEALGRMERGEVVEVSTAYWCEIEAVPGFYGNAPYLGIQRGIRPDHIALLPDEIGACSVTDGCGVPRVNRGGNMGDDRLLAARAAVALAANAVKGNGMEVENDAVALNGDEQERTEVATEPVAEPVTEPVVEATAEAAVEATVEAAVEVATEVEAGVEPAAEPVAEPVANTVELAGEPVDVGSAIVELKALVEAQAAQIAVQQAQIGDLLQCKAQMTDGLAAASAASREYTDQVLSLVAEGANGLQALAERFNASDLEVSEVMGALKVLGGVEWLTEVGNVIAALNEFGGVPALVGLKERFDYLSNVLANWTYEDMYMMYEFMDFVKQSGGVKEVANALEGVQVNTRRTKATIIRSLTGNSACAFGKEELEGMPLDVLEKLERSLVSHSYSGRGGERSGGGKENDGWEPYQAPASWKQ